MTHNPPNDPPHPTHDGIVRMELRPGDWIAGRFQVVRPLGQGGFGTIYEARQESMGNRRMAVKVLAPRNAHEPNAAQRFRQEALLASRLSHPNTITLFDHGQTDEGLFYIAMEYLEGDPLNTILYRCDKLKPDRVVHITAQILRSLAEAHSIGMIHRDLKPDNIFLCPIYGENDFVKVLDFGLAKIAGVLEDNAQVSGSSWNIAGRTDLTLEGLVCGTPDYMAPEQAKGLEPLTPACDVYAVGLLIYHMLTGQKPFAGATPMETLQHQIATPLPTLPAELQHERIVQVMHVATRKDPTARYSDASAMLYALHGRLPIDPTLPPESLDEPSHELAHVDDTSLEGADKTHVSDIATLHRLIDEESFKTRALQARTTPNETFEVEINLDSSTNPNFFVPGVVPNPPPPSQITSSTPQVLPSSQTLSTLHSIPKHNHVEEPDTASSESLETTAPEQSTLALQGLFGRDDELRLLTQNLTRNAQHFDWTISILEGPYGIGKSTLLHAALQPFHNDALIAFSTCTTTKHAPSPFASLRNALLSLLRLHIAPQQTLNSNDMKRAISRSLDDIGLYLDTEHIEALVQIFIFSPPRTQTPKTVLGRADTLVQVCMLLAHQKPFILAMDDIQNADPDTLTFLTRLTSTLQAYPSGLPFSILLGLQRLPSSTPSSPLSNFIASLHPLPPAAQTHLFLPPLSIDDSASILHNHLSPLHPSLTQTIHDLSQGNPLYTTLILRHLIGSKSLQTTPSGTHTLPQLSTPPSHILPSDLSLSIRAHIAETTRASSNPSAMTEFLHGISVLGPRFPKPLVHILFSVLSPPWSEDLIDNLIVELRRAYILLPPLPIHFDADPDQTQDMAELRFEHAALHSIIQHDAELSATFPKLHLRAARATRAFYGSTRDDLALTIANHFILAHEPHEALPFLLQAADHAERQRDLQTALHTYTRTQALFQNIPNLSEEACLQTLTRLATLALQLSLFDVASHALETILNTPFSPQLATPATRTRTHLQLAWIHHSLGHTPHAEQHLLSASNIAHASNDPALHLLILLHSAELLAEHNISPPLSTTQNLESLLAHLQNAPLLLARTRRLLAVCALLSDDPSLCGLYLAQALDAAQTHQDAILELRCTHTNGDLHTARQDHSQALHSLHDALDQARTLGARRDEALILRSIASLYRDKGDLNQAHTHAHNALLIFEDLLLVLDQSRTLSLISVLHELNGDLNTSIQTCKRALKLCRKLPEHYQADLRMRLGCLLLDTNQPEQATAHLTLAFNLYNTPPLHSMPPAGLHALGIIHSLQGRQDQAHAFLKQATNDALQTSHAPLQALSLISHSVVLHQLQTDPTQAATLLRRASHIIHTHQLHSLHTIERAAHDILHNTLHTTSFTHLPPLHQTWFRRLTGHA